MVKYLVSNKSFNNVYLALYESYLTGHPLKFYCFDDLYDHFDWTIEPQETIDELMDQRARQLREQYDNLILMWSGGYDSHTIYQVFRRNQIHIDHIYVSYTPKNPSMPEYNAVWITKNHWDPLTKIHHNSDHDWRLRQNFINNENWIFKDKGDLLKYGSSSSGYSISLMFSDLLGNQSWKAICGFEKPRLVYRNGHWHHRQLGKVLQHTMGHDHIEYFFLEPRLAIKQAHIFKRNVKNYIKLTNQPLYEGDWAESKYSRDPIGHQDWNLACGRLPELSFGASSIQKIVGDQIRSLKLNRRGPWKNILYNADLFLKEEIDRGNSTAIDYIKGLYNLVSDRNFFAWLNNHGWLHNQNILDLKFIWSKEYDLGA